MVDLNQLMDKLESIQEELLKIETEAVETMKLIRRELKKRKIVGDSFDFELDVKEVLFKLIQQAREEYPFILQPKHLFEILPHSDTKIYLMLENGEIPGARKAGGKWMINRDIFFTWLYVNEVQKGLGQAEGR